MARALKLLAVALVLVSCSSSSTNPNESSGGSGGSTSDGSADSANDGTAGMAGSGGSGGSGACGGACTGMTSCIEDKCQTTAYVACPSENCLPGLSAVYTGYAEACNATCPGGAYTILCLLPDYGFEKKTPGCPAGYHEAISIVFCAPETHIACVKD